MGKLEGKVAVITGGGTGIGRAAAKRFIEEGGAFVFIFGRRQRWLPWRIWPNNSGSHPSAGKTR